MQHTTYLFERGRRSRKFADDENTYELVIRLSGEDDKYYQLTGTKAGNRMINEVVELYIRDVSFGDDGLANAYCAWTRNKLAVTMNPKRGFGEPLLPSGYSAKSIWEAVASEGSIDAVTRVYGIDRMEVELACSYFDYLQGPPTA